MTSPVHPSALASQQLAGLKAWLCDSAFPRWIDTGLDRQQGGVFEKIDLDGTPVDLPRRARVQPRQIYAFAMARTFGFPRRASEAAAHACAFYLEHFFREDGLVRSVVGPDGSSLLEAPDLYDQAFALFGLSVIERFQIDPSAGQRASALIRKLDDFAHPAGGFRETSPNVTGLNANPNMHLLEAFLEWEEIDPSGPWAAHADRSARLALDYLIDPAGGGLREFFDNHWHPASGERGQIEEPGHQFEWSWLLIRWALRRNRGDVVQRAIRLSELALRQGIDPARGIAIGSCLSGGRVHDPVGRLWAQTEWIKLCALAAQVSGEAGWWEACNRAISAMTRFLDGAGTSGLWSDRMQADGTFVAEPAPASSFYHIVGAIAELDRCLRTDQTL